MAIKYITVNKDDTLYSIAKDNGTTVDELSELNNLKNPDLLAVGQKIQIDGTPASTVNNSNQVNILQFGLVSTSDTTLFATWEWTKDHTKSYQVKWEYTAKDWPNTWFVGSSTSISVDEHDPDASKQSTYSIPSNAVQIRFTVKPISESKDSNNKSVYWTANWSTAKTYNVSDNPPSVPPVPTVELTENLLLAKLENLSVRATVIQFQVLKRNKTRFDQFKISNTTIQYVDETDKANLINGYARYSCYVDLGGEYKVRARAVRDGLYSEWSEYSGSVYPAPEVPTGITTARASSETSVYLEWPAIDTAKSYDIQYATEMRYFEGSNQTTTEQGVITNHYELGGLEPGDEYFFRVRAVNEGGESEWSDIVSVIVGKKPGAPTTWASSTTVVAGESLIFYWVHNSEDGSSQTYAELEVTIGGMVEVFEIKNTDDEELKDKMSSYEFDTSGLIYGSAISWRVRTRGILPEYGEWSIYRTVDIYASPSLTLSVTDANGNDIETLSAFPIRVQATAGPLTQKPIAYHLAISANEAHETVDTVGNTKLVNAGEVIFSRHYDIATQLSTVLSAGDVSLENNVGYTITCTVTMDSGLSADASVIFTTAWSGDSYWPNAEVTIDTTSYTATIRPYCRDGYGVLVKDHTLSVYRRNFDGTFTELISGIPNDGATHITDPHPALDYARYRIVAVSTVTGAVSYYDMPGVEVGGFAIVLQWDEAWSSFDTPDANVPVEPSWTGSMLTLPYNIDVKEDAKPDVSHVEYIGRSHPVGYYGTQLGETASWAAVIDKSDKETLYGLRRLARWNGMVYVREPSGSGYWASVTVSLDLKHKELTVPVAITITRVEGGA